MGVFASSCDCIYDAHITSLLKHMRVTATVMVKWNV